MTEHDGGDVHRAPSAAGAAAAGEEARVQRTYLQLTARSQLRPGRESRRQAQWLRVPAPTVAEWRRLYKSVGDAWHWHDRDAWPDRQLAERLASSDVRIFRVDAALNPQCHNVAPALGFVELERHQDGSVEIVYFGLTRNAHGYGLGAWMLERSVDEAWALGATRVWLHTCTLDAPQALPNYLARGFQVERTEEYGAG